MSRSGPRLHRLPKRTDYILVPAPLDLSLPLVDEKSPLPAIIVTPSSPSSSRDFAIAFLADPPKPSLRERLSNTYATSAYTLKHFGPLSVRARSILLILIVIFILVCHLVTHRLAVRGPYLDLASSSHAFVGDSEAAAVQSWLELMNPFVREDGGVGLSSDAGAGAVAVGAGAVEAAADTLALTSGAVANAARALVGGQS